MKNIIGLREEIAKMRLNDLAKQYGNQSQRVTGYKQRMGELLDKPNKVDKSEGQRVKKLVY